MTVQSDESKKEFSVQELNAWDVEKLRKYLKNHGIVITSDTRKRDLVSKVNHACRLDLPLCGTKEQDDSQIEARRKEKLSIDGISLPFPEKLGNLVSGSHHFPDMTMSDIEVYLSKNNDRKSAKRGKISKKEETSLKSNTTTFRTVLSIVTYVEKLYLLFYIMWDMR